MIKHFCDSCGKETVRNFVTNRMTGKVRRNGKQIEYEVIVGVDGTWNSGDLCGACLVAILNHTDVLTPTGKGGNNP